MAGRRVARDLAGGGRAHLLIWFVAYGDVRVATRALLTMEGLTVTLIVIVVVVIFARVFAGTAPSGQSFTLSPFTPPSGPSRKPVSNSTMRCC